MWDDANNQDGKRPASVTVEFLANGSVVETATLNETNSWEHTWTELDVCANGTPITYTVTEANVPAEYEVEVTGDAATGFIVTNSHAPEKVTITANKVWNDNDNNDGKRPASVTVELLADGTVKETVTLNETNSWTHTWTGLEVYKAGTAIVYEVREVLDAETAQEYTAKVTGDAAGGYIITNTHEVEKTEVKVTKVWDDADNQDGYRPESIEVELLADGIVKDTVILNEANSWTYTWTELDVNKAGTAIQYTVQEVLDAATTEQYTAVVSGYVATGFVITNSHTTEVTVHKVWDDDNDHDGIRPDGILVQLYANGSAKGSSVVLDEAVDWTYTWTNLPKNEAGVEIVYTVDEVEVPQYYTMTVEKADNSNEFTITNSHEPNYDDVEYKHFTITKEWLDNNDAMGLIPDSITVRAYQNGVFVTDIVLSEDNNWTATAVWMSSRDGEEYTWTIEEVVVPNGYVASYDQDTLTVTNSLRTLPQTGDTSNVETFMATGIMALAGMAVLGKRRKEEDENE